MQLLTRQMAVKNIAKNCDMFLLLEVETPQIQLG